MFNTMLKWESKNLVFVILLTVFLCQLINANIDVNIKENNLFKERAPQAGKTTATSAPSPTPTQSPQPSGNSPSPTKGSPTTSSPSTKPSAAINLLITKPTPDKFQLIKRGHNVTFAWKYSDSFSSAPKSLNVYTIPRVLFGTGKNFTIATNLPGSATEVVWDTSKQTNPDLPEDTYTLWIWDERGNSYSGDVGRLVPFSGFTFSIYSPSPAIPAKSFVCVECQGKRIPTSAYLMGTMESFANILIPMTSLITFVSFITGIIFLNNHGVFEN